MKNLTLSLLGLVLIYIPACLSIKPRCFSLALSPPYPCCEGYTVVYVDEAGAWGIENGKWCGIGDGFNEEPSCFAAPLGYPCCKSCKVVYSDKDGDWGVEKNKWCGIKDICAPSIKIENPVDPVDPVQEDTEFDFSFLKMENNKKNMLYSPLSIKYALKMLQDGADTNTLDEIKKVLGNTELPKYANIDEILSLANGLFVRDTYYKYVKTEYINTLKEKYDAEIIEDEFKDAKNANKWIEEKTLGIIKNMLTDKTVQDPVSVMLLINALAIDMEWVSTFSDNSTHGESFYLDDGQEMVATMMSKKVGGKDFTFYESDDITAITMDLKEYGETQFEFMAIMPNKNLAAFVENVSNEQINEIDKNLKYASTMEDGVIIRIPKFKFSYDLNLKQDLINLGIRDAFNVDTSDFTKMADPEDPFIKLFVSDALHKADIEFTEKGVKAAAVTVFVMGAGATSVQRPTFPHVIVINKPFMFVIRDKKTKDIWFTGTVYEPNSWEKDSESYSPSIRF